MTLYILLSVNTQRAGLSEIFALAFQTVILLFSVWTCWQEIGSFTFCIFSSFPTMALFINLQLLLHYCNSLSTDWQIVCVCEVV